METAQFVLFANANLAEAAPSTELALPTEKRIGIGYYPIAQAEKIAQRRKTDRPRIRSELFSRWKLKDQGQKILVYAGGNNDEYFSKALPAFLKYLTEAALEESNFIVMLQQHPGAKEKNLDAKLVQQVPGIFVSEINSDDAQVIADRMFYYQTSMGPQFVLAGTPTTQVGHNIYEDILVKNGLCSVATNTAELLSALRQEMGKLESSETVIQGLGIRTDWADRLENVVLFHEIKFLGP
jgi:hypothetical protein